MGTVRLKYAKCVACKDDILKQCVGKGNQALCRYHWTAAHRKSKKRAKEDAQLVVIKQEILAERHWCEIRVEGCTGRATTVHHPTGHLNGKYLDKESLVPACVLCHDWAELNPDAAKVLGVSGERLAVNG